MRAAIRPGHSRSTGLAHLSIRRASREAYTEALD